MRRQAILIKFVKPSKQLNNNRTVIQKGVCVGEVLGGAVGNKKSLGGMEEG